MRTAIFQFSESGGSMNGPSLFTELPFLEKSLPNPWFTELPPPLSLKNLFSLKSASLHPLPKYQKGRQGAGVKGAGVANCRIFRSAVPSVVVWSILLVSLSGVKKEKVMTIYDAGPLAAGPLCGLLKTWALKGANLRKSAVLCENLRFGLSLSLSP